MASFEGKNVLFLQGTQTKLNDLMRNGGAKEGAFYLTNDTHRLYIGRADGNIVKPVAVNEGVVTVDTISNLPTTGVNVGEFYYVTEGNILCVYSGTGFVQINADTDTDTFISGVSDSTVSSDNSGITVSFNISQKSIDKNGDDITNTKAANINDYSASIPVSFKIDKSHLNTVLPDNISVGLEATALEGGVKVGTSGNGSDTNGIVNIKQGDNVTITVNEDDIVVAAKDTKYNLVAGNNGAVTLSAVDGSTNESVTFKSGNDILEVVSSADDKSVTYTHKEYTTTPGEATRTEVAHGNTFVVVDGITTDKGHVTGYTRKTIVLPEDQNTVNSSMAISTVANKSGANGAGSLVVSVTDSNQDTITARADDVLYNTITIDGTVKTVYNQQDLGAFYSAEKIDEIVSGVNAMTYKGTVESSDDLPTSEVKIGDTYMVAAVNTYNGIVCEIGDLLIATGEEKNGVITGNVIWTYVPSGDDTDTHYDVEVRSIENIDGADIVLGNDVNNDEDKVTILGGTAIDVNVDTVNSSITIVHENVARDDEENASESPSSDGTGTFTVVDEVVTNDQGHVIAVKTKDIVLPKDQNTTYELNLIADHKITLIGDSGSSTDFIQLNSGDDYISLVDDIDNSKISISHKAYNAEILGTAEKTAVELAHKGSFSAITGVERDAGGHVVGVVSETWSLPEDQNTTYSLEGVVTDIDNGVSVTSTLVGSDTSNDVAAFNLTSESLQIAKVDESNNIQVNLTWGSF